MIGYLSGYVSWVPLNASLGFTWDWYKPKIELFYLYWPFHHFGLVGLGYYFCLNILKRLTDVRLGVHLAAGVLSGILGSLWWWIFWGVWYFSLIHGTIWGGLVGLGVWRGCKRPNS